MSFTNKIKLFILNHPELFTVLGLGIIFYFIFLHNIGTYALMDVDESRYVSMAKDMFNSKNYLTLYLNNEFFFEKPPLYFWGEILSFKLFGGLINEFTARFPVAIYGISCVYLTYFLGRKIISRAYGVIASLILATSLEFVILAKFAILDIVVSTCIAFSLAFGIMVYYCKESNKKYFWWLFYIFSALAVMAKGIPGFVIPFGSMFFISICAKNFKELFKPLYLIPGVLLFLLITLPWHIIMLKTYNPLFWDEYIIKHHVARFLGSEVINREEPFYFYLVTILWGFFPWIISCLSVWIKNLVNCIKSKNFVFKYEELNNAQKFILFNSIIALFTLGFFSSSGTKLVTYILPIYLPLANLGAFVWLDFIKNNKNERIVNISSYSLGAIFVLASVVATFVTLFLPKDIIVAISDVKVFCILLLFATGLSLILFTKKKIKGAVFTTLVLFMTLLSAFGTGKFFNVDYKFGQNDLMEFAKYAKENNRNITTFDFGHKYCLIYYGNGPVKFCPGMEPEAIVQELESGDMVIIRNKHIPKYSEIEGAEYNTIMTGKRYSLVEGVGKNKDKK